MTLLSLMIVENMIYAEWT